MSLTAAAGVLVDRLGAAGIGLGVFLNGLGVPGLSEVLVPLGGVAVRQGRQSLVGLFVVAMICQMAGLMLAYVIGRRGGVPVIERYGKYVLVSSRELAAAQRAFERYGGRMVVVGAFVPGIQGFIGYVAGIAELQFGRFLLAAALGKLIWVGGLLYIGMVLGDHLDQIDRSIKQIGVVVLAALVAAGIWYVRRHRRHRVQAAARPSEEQ